MDGAQHDRSRCSELATFRAIQSDLTSFLGAFFSQKDLSMSTLLTIWQDRGMYALHACPDRLAKAPYTQLLYAACLDLLHTADIAELRGLPESLRQVVTGCAVLLVLYVLYATSSGVPVRVDEGVLLALRSADSALSALGTGFWAEGSHTLHHLVDHAGMQLGAYPGPLSRHLAQEHRGQQRPLSLGMKAEEAQQLLAAQGYCTSSSTSSPTPSGVADPVSAQQTRVRAHLAQRAEQRSRQQAAVSGRREQRLQRLLAKVYETRSRLQQRSGANTGAGADTGAGAGTTMRGRRGTAGWDPPPPIPIPVSAPMPVSHHKRPIEQAQAQAQGMGYDFIDFDLADLFSAGTGHEEEAEEEEQEEDALEEAEALLLELEREVAGVQLPAPAAAADDEHEQDEDDDEQLLAAEHMLLELEQQIQAVLVPEQQGQLGRRGQSKERERSKRKRKRRATAAADDDDDAVEEEEPRALTPTANRRTSTGTKARTRRGAARKRPSASSSSSAGGGAGGAGGGGGIEALLLDLEAAAADILR